MKKYLEIYLTAFLFFTSFCIPHTYISASENSNEYDSDYLGSLVEDMGQAQDPFIFWQSLDDRIRSLITNYVLDNEKYHIETIITPSTVDGIGDEFASYTVTKLGYYGEDEVWSHWHSIDWWYDGVYITSLDYHGYSGCGGSSGPLTWTYEYEFNTHALRQMDGQNYVCYTQGHFCVRLYGVPINDFDDYLQNSAWGDGSFY